MPSGNQMQSWITWLSDLEQRGLLIHAQPLGKKGKLLSGPRKILADVPVKEDSDMYSGFLMCHALDYENAIEIARDCPVLQGEDGRVEVREVQELNINANR